MKKYKLTKANITKLMNSNTHAVLSHDRLNSHITIVSTVYANSGCVPKIQVGERTYSPDVFSSKDVERLIEEGYKTISR